MRPSKEVYLMRMAAQAHVRATCDRLHVGCVIATPGGHIQVTGYNGSAPEAPHCDDDGHYMVDGHCVAGDVVISKFQTGHYNTGHRTIEEIYNNWQDPGKRGAMRRMKIRGVDSTGAIVPVGITDVWRAGLKDTIRVTTSLGRSVTLTPEHRVLTSSGWSRADTIGIGGLIALNGQPASEDTEWLVGRYSEGMTIEKIAEAVGRSRGFVRRRLLSQGVELRPFSLGGWNAGLTHGGSAKYGGRAVNPSSARERARRYALEDACTVCDSDSDLEVHHVDGDHLNDDLDNLKTLCADCHTIAHTPHAKLETVKFDSVVSVEAAGIVEVFDMSTDPHHNFVGNGVVLHNCLRTIHAERNALNQAARYGKATDGCIAYVTATPCTKCLQDLSSAGVSLVYVGCVYDNAGIDHSKALGLKIEVRYMPEGWETDDSVSVS